MKRIGILTAGGDTPALNATIFGAVERANDLGIEVCGIVDGFGGLVNPQVPHVRLNPLFATIPELDPCQGGTILGSSRTYLDPQDSDQTRQVKESFRRLRIDGLLCIGGDGTINGMQPLTGLLPCVLAPKTIDNDLGLNYIDEPNEWIQQGDDYLRESKHEDLELSEIINYATPGYATAVYVAASSIERIRTTAESHRRIAIVEVMGRQSGYIALGSAYGQPDLILLPEFPLNVDAILHRVRTLYELQKHVVIVIGEGVVDDRGRQLGAATNSFDPAGNILFDGAARAFKQMLIDRLGDEYFRGQRRHDTAEQAIFTRKVGHTQRGGRPIRFDRFHASQLGGKALELLAVEQNNSVATLQWSETGGFQLDSLLANKLRDPRQKIHPRLVHESLFDQKRFQPSRLGADYLMNIFTNAIGSDDVEFIRNEQFHPGNLATRYQSVNIDLSRRMEYLE